MTARASRLLAGAALIVALLAAGAANAVLPSEMLKDPALEARARSLSEELRCMVCQNQSIDDSEAPLAADIRVLLRQRLEAGDSDRQVLDFLVARYGEFILLKPRFNGHTALLWLAPLAVLVAGLGVAAAAYRRQRRVIPTPLDASEEEALRRVLADEISPHITES
jgi:cytochrome c-type biogenesis protein CcmH